MKPTSTFKMSKANKFRLASIRDQHLRGEIKRSLIEAQLIGEIKIKHTKEDQKNQME